MKRLISGLAIVAAAVAEGTASQAPGPNTAANRIETFELRSTVFGNSRTIRVLLPPDYAVQTLTRYPVLYFNDGYEVFTNWDVPAAVTRLIQTRRIAPLIVVGIDHAGEQERVDEDLSERANEYLPYAIPTEPAAPNPRGSQYPAFLIDEVMPAIRQRYRTKTGAANVGLGGASYGAYSALYTALKRPDVLSRVLIESGGAPADDSPLWNDVRSAMRLPALISIGVGTKEFDDETINQQFVLQARRMTALLKRVSPRTNVRLVVHDGGRLQPSAWRERLPAALTFLFGQP
jgi:enterochelin esterase-like enzyme